MSKRNPAKKAGLAAPAAPVSTPNSVNHVLSVAEQLGHVANGYVRALQQYPRKQVDIDPSFKHQRVVDCIL
jgi:hypothetical protein